MQKLLPKSPHKTDGVINMEMAGIPDLGNELIE